MKIKIFYPEQDGSIRLTKQELQTLLDEVYHEGYDDGRIHGNTYPWRWNGGIYTNTTDSNISLNNYTSSNVNSDSYKIEYRN